MTTFLETKPEPKFKVGDFVFSGIDSYAMKVINSCYDEHWRYQIFDDVNEYWFFEKELKKVEIGDVVYSKVWKEKVIVRDFCDDKFILVADFKGKLLKSLPSLIKQIKEKEETKSEEILEATGKHYWDMLGGEAKNEINLPEGYQFKDENGNIINATKIVLEKKKKEYPKSYEECAEIIAKLTGSDCNPKGCMGYMSVQLTALQKLFICRDAYWKIAGEEMGLGKPWEPDWCDYATKYCIYYSPQYRGFVKRQYDGIKHILAFPTEEMRDTFYENFKELIEICKELL